MRVPNSSKDSSLKSKNTQLPVHLEYFPPSHRAPSPSGAPGSAGYPEGSLAPAPIHQQLPPNSGSGLPEGGGVAGHPVPLRSAALPNLPCCAGALYCHLVHSLGTVEQNVTTETAALTMGSQH